MQRCSLLLVVPVTCVLACSDTTQPVHQYPPLPETVVRLSTAGVLGGPPRDTVCFGRQDPAQTPNYQVDASHFDSGPVTTFSDPSAPDTVCGNLSFNGRMRGFEAEYSTIADNEDENPWKYWWMRSRLAVSTDTGVLYEIDQDNVHPDSLARISFDSIELSDDYDAIGVILVLNSDSTLEISDLPFTELGWREVGDLNILFQFWAQKTEPVLNAVVRNDSIFTVTWTNRHDGRPIDSTSIYRDDDGAGDSLIRTVGPADTIVVDTVPGPGVYTYSLKHVSWPTVVSAGAPNRPPSPNSPSSNSLTDTIPFPAPPSVAIDGPTYITRPRHYTWTLDITGTSPFTYAWWLKPFGPGTQWQLVDTTSSYTRYVGYSDMGFQLRADVTDQYEQLGADTVAVSTAWGYGPVTGGTR